MTLRADLSLQDRSSVLRPGIRTYKPRRSRMTQREAAALVEHAEYVVAVQSAPLDLESMWDAPMPTVLEIGFGTGAATAAMAAAAPDVGILAVDVHTPGIGDLLDLVGDRALTNVRIIEADALAVLEFMISPAALLGVRSFFPDPWPKARHHKRRLVQHEVLALVGSRLEPGGFWHLATDWQEYADAMVACFDADPRWDGGVIDRPEDRPVTHYEGRALREGREITDVRYTWSP